jgi:NADPH:quinone reductase-like Zn-dependent oxidoreductase
MFKSIVRSLSQFCSSFAHTVGKDHMKAAVVTRYGSPDVVKVLDAPKPTPAAGEVLIRVHAATVNRTDCGELRAHPFFARFFYGLRRPKRMIFGLDFAGEVEAVGAAIGSFKSGDRVFGMCPSGSNGAHAEYVAVPERAIAAMPAGTPFDEAVVCEGAFYAHSALKRIDLKPGQKILIYGASGAIGTAMVQLAKSSGAAVTAVVATRHLELVESLGADRTIDYTSEDFTRIGETFDFVVDAVGKLSFFRCRKLLKPNGVFAATDLGPWGQNVVLAMWSSITRSHRVAMLVPGRINGFVGFLRSRMEAGQFRAVIDRKYPLAAIADAYRYVETGQKVGIVVISVVAADE